MDDDHLTRDLFQAVATGNLHPRALVDLGIAHLLELCPTCRREFEAWKKLRAPLAQSADYSDAFHSLARKLHGVTRIQKQEEIKASRDLKRLLGIRREDRMEAVKRARRNFRGSRFARLLLEESRLRLSRDNKEAYELAELAREVTNHSPATSDGFDLVVLSSAYMGNARRVSGDLREADSLLAFARFVIRRQKISDLDTLARVDHLEGSLRRDERRLNEADELLRRSAKLFRTAGDRRAEAKVLVTLGTVENQSGHPDRAITTTEWALAKIDAERDPRLFLSARYNLACFAFRSGALERAAEILGADAKLYEENPEPGFKLRHLWLQGNIAEARGGLELAEAHYRQTRAGFLGMGSGFDAALVSFDLALLFLRTGRTADVRQLAEEMFPIFEAADIHREALAALVLFQEAARQDELTASAVREFASYLKEARNDPAHKFREPS